MRFFRRDSVEPPVEEQLQLDPAAITVPENEAYLTQLGNPILSTIIIGPTPSEVQHVWASRHSTLFRLIAEEGFFGYQHEDDGLVLGRTASQYEIGREAAHALTVAMQAIRDPNVLQKSRTGAELDSVHPFTNTVVGYPIGAGAATAWLEHATALEGGFPQPGDIPYEDIGVTGMISNDVARSLL